MYLFLELGHHDFVDIVDALLGRPVVRDLARLDVLLREEVVEGANVLRHLGRTDEDHKVINLCPIQAGAKVRTNLTIFWSLYSGFWLTSACESDVQQQP